MRLPLAQLAADASTAATDALQARITTLEAENSALNARLARHASAAADELARARRASADAARAAADDERRRAEIERALLRAAAADDLDSAHARFAGDADEQAAAYEEELMQQRLESAARRAAHGERIRTVIESEEACRREASEARAELEERLRRSAGHQIVLGSRLASAQRAATADGVALATLSSELSLVEVTLTDAALGLDSLADEHSETLSRVSTEVEGARAQWRRAMRDERARHAQALDASACALEAHRLEAAAVLSEREAAHALAMGSLERELAAERAAMAQLERTVREGSSVLLRELGD